MQNFLDPSASDGHQLTVRCFDTGDMILSDSPYSDIPDGACQDKLLTSGYQPRAPNGNFPSLPHASFRKLI
jgi:hypothetical protein